MASTRQAEIAVGDQDDHLRQSQLPTRRQSLRRDLVAKFVLFIAATAIAFLMAEVLLRLFVEQETKRLASYDEDIGWRGRPNGRGVYHRNKDNIHVPFRYNNLGFRDDDLNPKPSGSERVLLLGDSFAESLEVEYDRIFHELLEQRLQSKRGDDAEVVILGSQGYSTAQELLAFRKFHELVSADSVLMLFYTGNDFEDNVRKQFAYLDEAGVLRMPENRDSQVRRHYLTVKRWLYESSHLVFLLKNRLESVTQTRFSAGSKETSEQSEQYKQDITAKLILRTRDEVEATGAKFGLVIIPTRDELKDPQSGTVARVVDVCARNLIHHLDLSGVLMPEYFFETDMHFNESGHVVVAEELEKFLAQLSEASEK